MSAGGLGAAGGSTIGALRVAVGTGVGGGTGAAVEIGAEIGVGVGAGAGPRLQATSDSAQGDHQEKLEKSG